MTTKIPARYATVTPYLIVKDAAAFIDFTQKVFDAGLLLKHMRDENIIMHGEIKIGTSIIMFADATVDYISQPGSFFIYVDDADATYAVALQQGAASVTEPANQPYGRSCGVKDIFGNTWWITSLV